MKDYLVSHYCIEKDRIISEPRSRDTVGDAVYTGMVINDKALDISNLYVITSDYHQRRAIVVFDYILGKKYRIHSPISFRTNPLINLITRKGRKERSSLAAFKKTFSDSERGNLEESYQTLTRFHPYYNGKIHGEIFN